MSKGRTKDLFYPEKDLQIEKTREVNEKVQFKELEDIKRTVTI